MKNSAYKRAKDSWFNKALIKFDKYAYAGGFAGLDAALGYATTGSWSNNQAGSVFNKSYKARGKEWKKWRRNMKGQITGSARNITGSAPIGSGRKGPVYGSNPHPPIYGSPPLPRDPVAYKMEWLTPIINPIEKWHKGRVC